MIAAQNDNNILCAAGLCQIQSFHFPLIQSQNTVFVVQIGALTGHTAKHDDGRIAAGSCGYRTLSRNQNGCHIQAVIGQCLGQAGGSFGGIGTGKAAGIVLIRSTGMVGCIDKALLAVVDILAVHSKEHTAADLGGIARSDIREVHGHIVAGCNRQGIVLVFQQNSSFRHDLPHQSRLCLELCLRRFISRGEIDFTGFTALGVAGLDSQKLVHIDIVGVQCLCRDDGENEQEHKHNHEHF